MSGQNNTSNSSAPNQMPPEQDSDERYATARSSTNRSPADYMKAMNAVLDIVEIAASFVPGGGRLAQLTKKALRYTPLARQIVKRVPDVAPAAAKIANAAREKAPAVLESGAQKASQAVKGASYAAGRVSGRAMVAAQSAVSAVGSILPAKALAEARKSASPHVDKARAEARQNVLAKASINLSAQQFLANWGSLSSDTSEGGFLDFGGCYVIATYAKPIKRENFAAFRDVFVAETANLGQAVRSDLTGSGSADIYADLKYGKTVHVFIYPCAAEQRSELARSLIVALDADTSYNQQK